MWALGRWDENCFLLLAFFFMINFYLGDRRATIDFLFFFCFLGDHGRSVIHRADRRVEELGIMSWHMVFGRYMNCYGALAELGHNNPQ